MNDIRAFHQFLPDWALSIAIILIIIGALLLIKRLVLSRLIRLAGKSSYFFDSLLLNAIKVPLSLLIFCIGLFILEKVPSKDSNFSEMIEGSMADFADLADEEQIATPHLSEAIGYRKFDRFLGQN